MAVTQEPGHLFVPMLRRRGRQDTESLGRDRDTKETWDKGENIKRKVGLRLETAEKQARTGGEGLNKRAVGVGWWLY